jgi:type III pantothenate kinase
VKTSLVIDQGNTVAKVSVFSGDTLLATHAFRNLDIEQIVPIIGDASSISAIYSSVARFDARFLETLRSIISGHLLILTHDTPLPVQIDYRTPATLGLDRIAAAVGASQVLPATAALIADAGTALTLDIVDASSTFRGGNISPGLSLRFSSLHQHTDALPLLSAQGPAPDFGYDTATAIRSGVLKSIAAEIQANFTDAHRLFGASKIILTGGDAPTLLPLLSRLSLPLLHNPNLVAVGLKRILQYNENI